MRKRRGKKEDATAIARGVDTGLQKQLSRRGEKIDVAIDMCLYFGCGVLCCVMCVICALCLIVVPLPQDKKSTCS
jgi:hypothetical protein